MSSRDNNNNRQRSSKRTRKETIHFGNKTSKNYNDMFPIEFDTTRPGPSSEVRTIVHLSEHKSNSPRTSIRETDIHLIISQMSETIEFLTEKLFRLSEEIRRIQNHSVLNIGNESVNKENEPLLEKFGTFEIPIDDQKRLEDLELELKFDQSFKTFFVSIKMSII